MGQTALETKSLCFNMGTRRHPLFGSSRDLFDQISSPTYAANRTESISANRMLIGPPWVKRHSKPNPYASTWENDVIHYSFPVATFSSRFRVQRIPVIELSRLAQTGCKSAHHGSNGTRNQIPMLQHGKMTSSTIRFLSRLFSSRFRVQREPLIELSRLAQTEC